MRHTLSKSTVDMYQYIIIVFEKTPVQDTGDVDLPVVNTRAAQCSREAIRVANSMVAYPQTLDHAPPGTLDVAAVFTQPVPYRSWGDFVLGMPPCTLRGHRAVLADVKRPISGGDLCSQRVGNMVVSRSTTYTPGPIWVRFQTCLFTCYVEEAAGSRVYGSWTKGAHVKPLVASPLLCVCH